MTVSSMFRGRPRMDGHIDDMAILQHHRAVRRPIPQHRAFLLPLQFASDPPDPALFQRRSSVRPAVSIGTNSGAALPLLVSCKISHAARIRPRKPDPGACGNRCWRRPDGSTGPVVDVHQHVVGDGEPPTGLAADSPEAMPSRALAVA